MRISTPTKLVLAAAVLAHVAVAQLALAPLAVADESAPAPSPAPAQATIKAPVAKLLLLDGQTIPAQSLAVAGGKVTGAGVPANLLLDDLRQIEFAPATAVGDNQAAGDAKADKTPAAMATIAIDLFGGGELRGKTVAIADDRGTLYGATPERISLPIDALRAIRFGVEAPPADFAKALAAPLADQDQIFLREQDKAVRVVGLIESLSGTELAFDLDGTRHTIPRAKLLAVVLAQAQADDPPTAATVALANGSTASGELASLTSESLMLKLPSGAELTVPTAAVRSVTLRSSRVAYLSDLKPVEASEQPVVTLGRPWQKNRSVAGRPLTLAGRVFADGIGVHARSQLTFANDGGFDVLAGVIGIDGETNGRGDCTFIVLGDGQPLYSQRVQGSDPPRDLRVDIGGRKQVTLLVEPGADLDLADHADWCEIRFIKNRK